VKDPSRIPDGVRELLNGALTAIWDGIGPGGRDAVRGLHQTLADADEDEAREIFLDFVNQFRGQVERAQLDPDLLVYGDMPADAADALLARRADDLSIIVDSVLRAHSDPDAIAEILAALEASMVSDSQRERISAGLTALREPGMTWAVPCDLLLGGVEGMIWELAEAREIAVPDCEGKPRDRDGRPVRSVNGMLHPDVGLEIPQRLRQFLTGRLLAGHGHSVRHRRRADLQRDWTAYTLVALRGLLDDIGGHHLIQGLAERLSAQG
jgi:hypothetical protein